MGHAFLHAQTAAELETILEARVLNCGQAAFFVISSAGITDGGAALGIESEADAFTLALNRGWLPKGTAMDESISLGKLSLLLMKAFDIKGGLFYRLMPSPRYAFRAMVSQFYIQEEADPGMKVSGQSFLDILGRVLNAKGGEI